MLGDKPLVFHVLDALRPLSDDVFLVGKVTAAHERSGLPLYGDRYDGRSSMVGIYSALAAAREQYCLVAPCDMPFLEAELARLMATVADGFDVVVPEGPAGREPLFALYAKSCLDPMATSIERDRMKMMELLDGLRVRWVRRGEVESVCDPSRTFFNVNSRSDLIQARQLLGSRPGAQTSDAGFRRNGLAPLVCFVGNKNSGKTSLVERLVALLTSRGLKVACIKHDAHGFTIDREGTDTRRFSEAGAARVIISSPGSTAMLESIDGERGLDELIALAGADVDMIIAEGFKRSSADKIEVHGEDDPDNLVCIEEELLALVSDRPLPGVNLRTFRHNDIEGVAGLVMDRYSLSPAMERKRSQ
jgi:molybdopterin-guanine dinucleotide biosynthesis protein